MPDPTRAPGPDSRDWLAEVALDLGLAPLEDDEVAALLDLARDVAHATERRFAPLTCFLVGLAVAGDRDEVVALAARLGAMSAGR